MQNDNNQNNPNSPAEPTATAAQDQNQQVGGQTAQNTPAEVTTPGVAAVSAPTGSPTSTASAQENTGTPDVSQANSNPVRNTQQTVTPANPTTPPALESNPMPTANPVVPPNQPNQQAANTQAGQDLVATQQGGQDMNTNNNQ